MAVKLDALGLKFPVPLVDQTPPLALFTLPLKGTPETSAQMLTSFPADTVGAELKVSSKASLYALHVPLPVVVKVRVTLPLPVSAELGR